MDIRTLLNSTPDTVKLNKREAKYVSYIIEPVRPVEFMMKPIKLIIPIILTLNSPLRL
jgi:hypothetical protein